MLCIVCAVRLLTNLETTYLGVGTVLCGSGGMMLCKTLFSSLSCWMVRALFKSSGVMQPTRNQVTFSILTLVWVSQLTLTYLYVVHFVHNQSSSSSRGSSRYKRDRRRPEPYEQEVEAVAGIFYPLVMASGPRVV